ncbi:ATP synthase subunit I [Donghicola eburneus]|uniref:N-ATPase subunit AtpR n=1 Tax=Donghicola eburneus TaxID=393278 RepID=UPI000B86FD21|nr:ATP synthase subunit I [Donghicola eburneus]
MTELTMFIAFGGLAGFILGLAHFLSLSRVVQMLVGGPVGLGLVLQLVRFAVLGGALYGIAQLGPLPLLAALAGVILARVLVLRRSRPTNEAV